MAKKTSMKKTMTVCLQKGCTKIIPADTKSRLCDDHEKALSKSAKGSKVKKEKKAKSAKVASDLTPRQLLRAKIREEANNTPQKREISSALEKLRANGVDRETLCKGLGVKSTRLNSLTRGFSNGSDEQRLKLAAMLEDLKVTSTPVKLDAEEKALSGSLKVAATKFAKAIGTSRLHRLIEAGQLDLFDL